MTTGGTSEGGDDQTPVDKTPDETPPPVNEKNNGKLLIDASCAPSDIRYPTDLSILNEAREKSEAIIDGLHVPDIGQKAKPRTYRQKARKNYLAVAKKRKPTRKAIRKTVVNGLVYLDRLSWDAYNEGGDLPGQVEAYRRRHGHHPESVHADGIYRTRENIRYCKKRNIRLSGPPLGRPIKDPAAHNAQRDQMRRDEVDRFLERGADTGATAIADILLVINLETLLRRFLSLFFLLVQ